MIVVDYSRKAETANNLFVSKDEAGKLDSNGYEFAYLERVYIDGLEFVQPYRVVREEIPMTKKKLFKTVEYTKVEITNVPVGDLIPGSTTTYYGIPCIESSGVRLFIDANTGLPITKKGLTREQMKDLVGLNPKYIGQLDYIAGADVHAFYEAAANSLDEILRYQSTYIKNASTEEFANECLQETKKFADNYAVVQKNMSVVNNIRKGRVNG